MTAGGDQTYGYTVNYTCLTKCATGYYGYGTMCMTSCTENGFYADAVTNLCSPNCSVKGTTTYYSLDLSINTCVTNCSSVSGNTALIYGSTNTPNFPACVSSCNPQFANLNTFLCGNTCPTNTFADSLTWTCVLTCPVNGVQTYGFAGVCQSSCSPNYFYNTGFICVTACPTSPTLTFLNKITISSGIC